MPRDAKGLAYATGACADNSTTYATRPNSRQAPRAFFSEPDLQLPVSTLHLTNGDHAADGIRRSGVPGTVLPWRDILHDGAVLADDDQQAFGRARAAFVVDRGWATADEVITDLAARDALVDAAGAESEIVLWFEPDLYDQLQLVQILARLYRRPRSDRPRITIVPADCYLGPLAPERFVPLYDVRRDIGADALHCGADVWRAFTAASPVGLLRVVEQLDPSSEGVTYSAHERVTLPYLAAAMRRQLEEYPDARNGLSRTERQCCEALVPGPITLAALFASSSQASESWFFLGDWSFAWYAQRLSECARPVLEHTNGTPVYAPAPGGDARRFWERRVQLTPFGREVVCERADVIEANGIDRWIGGAHLTTAHHWRWDAGLQRLVERVTHAT